jgi:four helix bundle protein
MQKISSYQQLEVWQKSMGLVTEIYQISAIFPKTEIFGLTSQMRRAAVSVPANIAEGWGRKLTKEFMQFLRIARGSLLEIETHLIISRNLDYIDVEKVQVLLSLTTEISKMLNGMIISLGKK